MSQSAEKKNLLGMPMAALKAFFAEMGEKPFRAQQVMKWIHHHGVTDFEQMTNMSKSLREKLQTLAIVECPEVVYDHLSSDGTRKWAISVGGNYVETVMIPDGNRTTLCVSSQVGCSLDCSFCSTGKQGFNRNLSTAEIISQIWIAFHNNPHRQDTNNKAVTNVVFMGMGEPLLNFDPVMDATSIMMDDFGYGISKRRVTISTSGVVPGLQKMTGLTDVSLALSLHAPNNALRDELVPINKKYPLEVLLPVCDDYMSSLSERRVITIEYTVIKGVNDSLEQAKELAVLLKKTPCKINLIPFNPFSASDYERPSRNAVMRFQRVLLEAGYTATIRTTRGDDILAACGQLAGQIKDKTRRSQRYLAANDSVKTVQSEPIKVIPH